MLYGLKGMAAYADHAHILGQQDESVRTHICLIKHLPSLIQLDNTHAPSFIRHFIDPSLIR